jgi:hypothetical protein
MEPIKAKIYKDQEHPGRLLPWRAEIPGFITLTFSEQGKALVYANHCVKWLRQEFTNYVISNPERIVS